MFLEILMVCDSSFILDMIRSLLSVCFRSRSSFSVLIVGECTCLLYISCALFVDFIRLYLGLSGVVGYEIPLRPYTTGACFRYTCVRFLPSNRFCHVLRMSRLSSCCSSGAVVIALGSYSDVSYLIADLIYLQKFVTFFDPDTSSGRRLSDVVRNTDRKSVV